IRPGQAGRRALPLADAAGGHSRPHSRQCRGRVRRMRPHGTGAPGPQRPPPAAAGSRLQFPTGVRHGDSFDRAIPAARFPVSVPGHSTGGRLRGSGPGDRPDQQFAIFCGRRLRERRPRSGGRGRRRESHVVWRRSMADLTTRFAGIQSPNPFWLASGPPSNCGDQVARAFDAGWGGAVWKTIGEPIVNVSSRYSSLDWNGLRMMGLNNIELITDRPVETNLREIAEVKKRYSKHAVIASLMVESRREAWHAIVRRTEDAGADGLELNFGCPHGMSERGMGSAVGQVPEYAKLITEWVKEVARTPVLVKLTPNVADIRAIARAAKLGGADGLSAINTLNSITGVDLDTFTPRPDVGGQSSHGGYCGPAVKPIALHMVQQLAGDPECGLPVSGIGGISGWREAAEFLLLGCHSVQVCTAVMHYGYR